MMSETDEDDAYVTCHACGHKVFHDVSECPYCGNDPSGEFDSCAYCGKVIAVGVAQCPYCKEYTDGDTFGRTHRGKGGMFRRADGKLYPIYVIAAWLVVIITLFPFAWALYRWITK
ncbi:MAG TPA: hypothetical protein VEJ63_12475 [Planctomycetota bacterium]|nr:hypothetical protein [Planctomycetota bacterium]